MAIEDYFDPYYDEYDAVVSCKFCGKTPLYWVPAPNGAWRLVDEDGAAHNCRNRAAKASEFEDLSKES